MTTTPATYIEIDIDEWTGPYPAGHDLVVHERGGDPADGLVLYGFDEIGEFDDEFAHPTYSFVKGG